jgi:hypothetical protein
MRFSWLKQYKYRLCVRVHMLPSFSSSPTQHQVTMESKRLLSFSLVALLTIGVSKAREFPWEHPMTDAAGQGGGGGELKVEVP